MRRLVFLRHGQARNNTDRVLAGRTAGIPLTDEGVRQAEYAAGMLERMGVCAIYTSPIERASRTADIVGRRCSVPVVADDRLIELDTGKYTGMGYDEIFGIHGNVFLKMYQGDLEIAHNGVETFEQVRSRVAAMVDHVLDAHREGSVVLVTHMDPIKAMISAVLRLTPANLFDMIIANASLNIFRETEGGFAISGLNVMEPSRYGLQW